VLPPVHVVGTDAASFWWPFMVSWSPDGQKLLYDAWAGSVSVGLVVVDADGRSPPTVLATTDVADGGAGDFGGGGSWVRPFSSWGWLPDSGGSQASALGDQPSSLAGQSADPGYPHVRPRP
jgi:hypothetical protein